MTPELAAQLVRHGLWRPGRALSYLAQLGSASGCSRADGVVALAPYLSEQHLPALWQIVETLQDAVCEAIAPATAGWARRALELGRPHEAIAAASWLPDDHGNRDFVRIWVCAELVPRLPRHLAGMVLADAIEVLCQSRLVFAACHLTKCVPLELAESVWPYPDYATLPEAIRSSYPQSSLAFYGPGCGPGELLCAALDRCCINGWPFSRPLDSYWDAERGFREHIWMVDKREFVGAARWLAADRRAEVVTKVLHTFSLDKSQSRHTSTAYYDAFRALEPDLHYDGLLSVLPREFAPLVADLLLHHDRHVNPACLLHLLPLLDPEDRAVYADAVFARPQLLAKMHLNSILVLGPVVADNGYAGRVLDAIESGELPKKDSYYWLKTLAPHFSRAEIERALTIFESPPWESDDEFDSRRWLLAGLAQFGVRDAHRALDLLYARSRISRSPEEG